jgi:hypothetical protein
MALFEPPDQFSQSLVNFLSRLPHLWRGIQRNGSELPAVPLVIRVGAAGHLDIGDKESLYLALEGAFAALASYADDINQSYWQALWGSGACQTPPILRLVSQLAPGLDQLAARVALDKSFELDVVLPARRAMVERDIQRTLVSIETSRDKARRSSNSYDTLQNFRDLLSAARRVLELDSSSQDLSEQLTYGDYEQAGNVILCNCDILLVPRPHRFVVSHVSNARLGAPRLLWSGNESIRSRY